MYKIELAATNRRRLLIGVAFAALFAISPGPVNAQETFKIGAAYSLTGPASFLGDSSLKAAKLAIEQANAAGRIHGRSVELISEDGKSTETATVLAVRKLISEHNVAIILGPSTTGSAMASIPIANEAGVVLLPHVSGVAVVNPVKERAFIFRPGQGGELSVGKIIDYAKAAGWKKLGILYSSDAYGEDGRTNLKKLAPAAGIQVVSEASFPVNATDLKAQLTVLKNAGIDAIFMHGIGAPSVVVYKNAKELALGVPLISGHGQANAAFRKAVGDAVVGQPVVGAPILVWKELPDTHPQKKKAKAFAESFEAKYGAAPDMFAGVAFDAANMALDALRAVGSDRQKIRDWLESHIKHYVGVTGVFTFSPDDHAGLTRDALVMMIATEGGGWRLADHEK